MSRHKAIREELMIELRNKGMTYEVIGNIVGCSRSTVRRHVSAGEIKKPYELEDHRESQRRYRIAHPERAKASLRQSYNKYREQRLESGRLYFLANRDEVRARKKIYRDTHKDEIRDRQRSWRNTDAGREWYRLHEQWKRSVKRDGDGIPIGIIDKLLDKQGGMCAYCGRSMLIDGDKNDPGYMTIDHIIPLSKGGEHAEHNVALACRSCNSKKGAKLSWHEGCAK